MDAIRISLLMSTLLGFTACEDDSGKLSGVNNPPARAWMSGAEIAEILCPFQAACEEHGSLQWCVERYAINQWLRASDQRRVEMTAKAECLLEAADCDAYRTCVYASQTCTTSRCDGDIARLCNQGVETTQDCGAERLECIKEGDDDPYCGIPDILCEGRLEQTCEGNVFVWCPGEQPERPIFTECGTLGKVCSTLCVDPGTPACEEKSCAADGVTLRNCYDGMTASFKCTELGLDYRCVTESDGGVGCGVSSPCDALEANRCDGDTAILCHDTIRSIDCSRVRATCSMASGAPSCVFE